MVMTSRTRKTVRVLSIILIILSVCLSGLVMHRIAFRTDYFNVDKFEITGLKMMPESELLSALMPHRGLKLFSFRWNLVEKELATVTRVQKVRLKRIWPDEILVEVKERQPVALINTKTEFRYMVFSLDTEGVLLAEGSRIYDFDLPVITGLELKGLFAGDRAELPELLKLLSDLEKLRLTRPELFAFINEINFSRKYDRIRYTLYVSGRNIPFYTDRLDEQVFVMLGGVIGVQKNLDRILSLVCLSNMIYVDRET